MSLVPKRRWCKVLCFSITLVVVFVGFWTYLIATRSPINQKNYEMLISGMRRAEVESLLGTPTEPSRLVQAPPLQPESPDVPVSNRPWWLDHDIPGFPVYVIGCGPEFPPRIGDLLPGRLEKRSTNSELPSVVEVCTWDGPDAQMVASFDDQGRMIGARIQMRFSWRGKVREWLPWLP